MKQTFVRLLLALLLAISMSAAVQAQTLDEAARQAARQYNAKVLSAHTVQEGNQRVHIIKLLTDKGVVKTVRVRVREK
jgi:outer membrane lipoprotein-sorting protein